MQMHWTCPPYPLYLPLPLPQSQFDPYSPQLNHFNYLPATATSAAATIFSLLSPPSPLLSLPPLSLRITLSPSYSLLDTPLLITLTMSSSPTAQHPHPNPLPFPSSPHSLLCTPQCGICRDPFVDPVTSKCGHSFCRACVVEYISTVAGE
jgi:RING-type zinc-finger